MFSRGQLHQQCCEEWTLVSEETQAKMARMAAAAAWGLGNHSNVSYQIRMDNIVAVSVFKRRLVQGAFRPAFV